MVLGPSSVEHTTSEDTRQWYAKYYDRHGDLRNDLLYNPEVLFQYLALDAAMIRALRRAEITRESAILDVGCGTGSALGFLLRLGFSNLSGIDVLSDRIAEAQALYPRANISCHDAADMPYPEGAFDLVMESTMFVQIVDDEKARRIAAEMIRVTKPGGYILLNDWRYGKPGSRSYAALSLARIRNLFPLNVVCQVNGALVPPVGRFVSRHAPSWYFLISAVFPFLVGSKVTLLRRAAV